MRGIQYYKKYSNGLLELEVLKGENKMAEGDITKEFVHDKIEIVNTWTIQVRKVTKIMEEKADGSKIEISRSFHRHSLTPFTSEKKDGEWTHRPTDLSGEDAKVKVIEKLFGMMIPKLHIKHLGKLQIDK